MKKINPDSLEIKYKAFYNIYPNIDEVSIQAPTRGTNSNFDLHYPPQTIYLDEEYGRIYNQRIIKSTVPYGLSQFMKYYPPKLEFEIAETLRVPFRKVPVYKINNKKELEESLNALRKEAPNYELLIRGQSTIYKLKREEKYSVALYGEKQINEPSFHPSFLRLHYNEKFIQSMWINQVSYILNDISIEQSEKNNQEPNSHMYDDYRRSRNFYHFAFGLAQHYGLPSLGLDLTNDIDVATWFASNKFVTEGNGKTTFKPIDDFDQSTIFIFRCPKNAVYDYSYLKPQNFPNGRPDKQSAWFGHVGWGSAKNQLGSYLMCAFRIDKNFVDFSLETKSKELFPTRDEDPVLNIFLKLKEMDKYAPKCKELINRIYYTE
jgi:hypothetical protein